MALMLVLSCINYVRSVFVVSAVLLQLTGMIVQKYVCVLLFLSVVVMTMKYEIIPQQFKFYARYFARNRTQRIVHNLSIVELCLLLPGLNCVEACRQIQRISSSICSIYMRKKELRDYGIQIIIYTLCYYRKLHLKNVVIIHQECIAKAVLIS